MVLGGVEQGTELSLMNMSMMTWWLCWAFQCKQGSGEQAGVGWVSGKCLRAVLVCLGASSIISGLWFVPEGPRAGDMAAVKGHIIDDMAGHVDMHGIFVGWWCITKARGASREGLGGVESGLDHCWEWWGQQGGFH
jgi:hypothetical protein